MRMRHMHGTCPARAQLLTHVCAIAHVYWRPVGEAVGQNVRAGVS